MKDKKFSLKTAAEKTTGNRPKRVQSSDNEDDGNFNKGLVMFGIKKLTESRKYLSITISIVFLLLYCLFSFLYDIIVLALNNKSVTCYIVVISVSFYIGWQLYRKLGWVFEHHYLLMKLYLKPFDTFTDDDLHILMNSRYTYSLNMRNLKLSLKLKSLKIVQLKEKIQLFILKSLFKLKPNRIQPNKTK